MDTVGVDSVSRLISSLSSLPGLKYGTRLDGTLDAVARLRIPSLARLSAPQSETAEASKLDLLTSMQRVDDAPKNSLDNDFRVLLGEIRDACNLFDEGSLRHATTRDDPHFIECVGAAHESDVWLCLKWSPKVTSGESLVA